MFNFLLWYLVFKINMKKYKKNHKTNTWNKAKGCFDSAQWDRERRVPQRAQNLSPSSYQQQRERLLGSQNRASRRRRLPHSLLVSVSVSSVLVEHWSAAGVFWRELSRAKNEAFPVGCVRTFFFLFFARGLGGKFSRAVWHQSNQDSVCCVVLCCAVCILPYAEPR